MAEKRDKWYLGHLQGTSAVTALLRTGLICCKLSLTTTGHGAEPSGLIITVEDTKQLPYAAQMVSTDEAAAYMLHAESMVCISEKAIASFLLETAGKVRKVR